jgi:uncharacterized protein
MSNGAILTGTILNALGILIGGLAGLNRTRQLAPSTQVAIRGIMGVITVYVGLRLTVMGLNGSVGHVFKQIAIMLLAMMLGKLIGQLLRIQSSLNRLGQHASQSFAKTRPEDPNRISDGFTLCTLLFCAGPLGPLGAVQDGLSGYWQPLAIKMVMDGLAAMGFVSIYGWGVVLSAIPVFIYQGTITLAVQRLEPFLHQHGLVDSVNVVGGMLIFSVALIILELKKIQLADYLPSLVVAPLITYFWR